MNCTEHKDLEYLYTCKTCGKKLCRECKPVSFRGRILCLACSEAEEQALFNRETIKSRYQSYKLGQWFVFLLIALLSGAGYYFMIYTPREVNIPSDDKERLRYYLNLAYEAKNNSETYKRQMNNILRLNDDYANVIQFLKFGEKALSQSRFGDAYIYFEKVKKMLPDWEWIYILTSKCYIGMNNKKQAEEELKQAQELNPDGSRAYVLLGELYASEGDFEQAILEYSKALFIDGKNSDVMLNLAELYYRKKSLIKAQEFRDSARKLGANTQKIDEMLRNRP
jgi:tetratricopeptide (TPR) repeat protein